MEALFGKKKRRPGGTLVLYTTRHGATQRYAERIAEPLFGRVFGQLKGAWSAAVGNEPALGAQKMRHLDDVISRPLETLSQFIHRNEYRAVPVRQVHEHAQTQIREAG